MIIHQNVIAKSARQAYWDSAPLSKVPDLRFGPDNHRHEQDMKEYAQTVGEPPRLHMAW